MPTLRSLMLLATALLAAIRLPAASPETAASFRPVNLASWSTEGAHPFVELKDGKPAVAVFTVPAGGAGFYAVTNSRIRRDTATTGRIELGLQVTHAGARPDQQPPPAVQTTLDAGELFDFDAFLGYLDAGDIVELKLGPAGDGSAGDRAELDCRIERTPFIPVSVMAEDIGPVSAAITPGTWSLSENVPVDLPAERRLAWGRNSVAQPAGSLQSGRVSLSEGAGDALATFAVPQSGYYALHDAWLTVAKGAVEARLFVGTESRPRRIFRVGPATGRMSLNTDLGYIARGELVHLGLVRGTGSGAVEFAGSVIEWAPRRAPLRVRRGTDGYLDVFEPQAPRLAVDIPADHWITVPASDRDATEVIRQAFTQAAARSKAGGYTGVRLEGGRTYVVASQQARGRVFDLRGLERVVFDGNGATLHIGSAELARQELQLFHLTACHNLVFADFTATAAETPFSTGEILDVSPRGESETTQTVTFRVDPRELDPLKDIARNGRSAGYAYDPRIPGRPGLGTWTHYPDDGDPSIKATDRPGVFTHRVTRTNNSIEPGMKWLIKNKKAGVIYLETLGGTENITLSGVDGRAAGGGQLRFWQTSGINILDCRFEPDGDNWISSSADGVHGRGREGVWIENTLLRGICEDILNTYGQNMIVLADDNPDDAGMTIRMFHHTVETATDRALPRPTPENLVVGDQLVFFNPANGRVLGYAGVLAADGDRFTLTHPVPGVEAWEEGRGRNATVVYNTRVAGRFFVRDSRFMDSMRYALYIKARGGVVLGSQFEGLSAPAIFAANEPEWPEGPPPTHLWVQGCVFSQNNYGFMSRHRAFLDVDPADISVYTRRFRDPAFPADHRGFITRGQYANSHVKLLDNVFHDWRGMGISVRNAKNVRIEDNRFLPPVNDEVMRATLARDPVLNEAGRGAYAAIHLDSVGGARVTGNRFHGLPAGDRTLAQGADVAGLVALDNAAVPLPNPAAGANSEMHPATPPVALSFDEWFGDQSVESAGIGAATDQVTLRGATHRAGRLGAGLYLLAGTSAVIAGTADTGAAVRQFGVALWVAPESVAGPRQSVFAQGGVSLVLEDGRWRVGGVDLGPAVKGCWQHVAFSFEDGLLRGYINGCEVAQARADLTLKTAADAPGTFGGGMFHGLLDEFRLWARAPEADELAALALGRMLPAQGTNSTRRVVAERVSVSFGDEAKSSRLPLHGEISGLGRMEGATP